MAAPDKLLRWVSNELLPVGDDEDYALPDRVELWHTVEGSPSEHLHSQPITDDDDAEELTSLLYEKALDDASTRPGGNPERYFVQTVMPEAERHRNRFPFRISGDDKQRHNSFNLGHQFEGLPSEPNNESGALAQVMRHNESLHHNQNIMFQSTTGHLARELEQSRSQVLALQKLHMENLQTREELLDRKHERDMAQRREEARERRHEQFIQLLMGLAPALLPQLLGGAGGTNGADPRLQAVQNFMGSLSEMELAGVMDALEPEHQKQMLAAYKALRPANSESEEDEAAE